MLDLTSVFEILEILEMNLMFFRVFIVCVGILFYELLAEKRLFNLNHD